MSRIKRVLALVLAAAVLLPLIPVFEITAFAEYSGMVRVKITRLGSPEKITFTTGCEYYIDGDTNTAIPSGASVTVSASSDTLLLSCGSYSLNMGDDFTINRKYAGVSGVKFTSPSLSNVYCGDLRFMLDGKTITTILTIYIEDYLYGVVGYEMSNSYPLEALKAQAVAARNAALRHMSASSKKAYDILDNSNDQVFKGYNSSYTRTINAVDSTRGMVLGYNGKLAACYYSSSNGGQTESTKHAWGGSYAYSVVKEDRYDLEGMGKKNSVTFKKDQSDVATDANLKQALIDAMADALEKYDCSTDPDDVRIERIVDIELHSPVYEAPSILYKKAAFTVEVSSVNSAGERLTGTVTVDIPTYNGLEDWFNLSINSKDNETVTLTETEDAFTITFRRNGHGVGLSQHGARIMALNYSLDYEDILEFYFPGCELTHIDLSDNSGSGNAPSGDNSDLSKPAEPAVTPEPEAEPETGKTEEPAMQATVRLSNKTSTLNMRKSPSTSSAVLRKLKHGAVVDVYALEGSWVRIGVGDLRGYVMKKYLVKYEAEPEATPAPTPVPDNGGDADAVYASVKLSNASSRLKLRQKPSTSAKVMALLNHGQYVKVTALSGSWAKVETENGETGYVYKKYLRRVYIDGFAKKDEPAADEAAMPEDSIAAVAVNSTFMYAEPDVYANVSAGINAGENVTVTEYDSEWAYCIYNGQKGFVPVADLRKANQ